MKQHVKEERLGIEDEETDRKRTDRQEGIPFDLEILNYLQE